VVRKAASGVFALTVAALIPFWVEKGTAPTGHWVLWVLYAVLLVSGAILLASYAPARYLPPVKVEVRWPARDSALKALKRRRKHLRGLLDGPAMREWDRETLRHSVEIEERDFGADLSRYAPQYGSRWHGLPRYSTATPPNSQAEFFEMRLAQAVRLLDEIIADMQTGTKP
jgi:hypothetical protein